MRDGAIGTGVKRVRVQMSENVKEEEEDVNGYIKREDPWRVRDGKE